MTASNNIPHDPLLAFYSGVGTDGSGRTLEQILQWDDARLERTHDYVQWLFPNDVPSPVNPDAPTVTPRHRQAFAQKPELRQNLRRALLRMLGFYGLQMSGEADRPHITRAPDWQDKQANWLTRGNHNHLRLTRILKCLSLLALADDAKALYTCLDTIAQSPEGAAISPTTRQFWKDASAENR